MRKFQIGITIFEFIVTVIIIAVLSTIAIPHFKSILANLEAKKVNSTLHTLVRDSKHQAYTFKRRIGICGSSNGFNCENNSWSKKIIIFHDKNMNRILDSSEATLRAINLDLKYGELQWNGFNGSTLFFQPDTGLPRGSNGRFTYCSHSHNQHYKILVSMMGHSRTEKLQSC
ncbi:GspH/FimT family pseudopilin [Acinetobacter sp. A3.8]|uniref:Type II secretion system protein H n=1 Tax=Acinetobacter sedimenti TaxID=2919922 RepID=A0A9X1WVM7_9GAMM|nr:GspH/FimT family pseudopilin [Acinetobacter sedimenti]MCJ8146029.1 GspH/FimT family pseudopilin [Acinetobacter sedimenti]